MDEAYILAKLKARKKETRRKIEYGGLVVKSGLDQEPKDVVLGASISAVEALQNEPGTRELFKSKGLRAFLKLDA